MRDSLGSGQGDTQLTGSLRTISEDRRNQARGIATVTTSASFYRGTDEDQLTGDASVLVLRTSTGLLAYVTYTHTANLTAAPGESFAFTDPAFAKALAAEGSLTSFTRRAGCSAILLIADTGATTMAGSTCVDII